MTTPAIATVARTLRDSDTQTQVLWRLDPPHAGHAHVVTSAVTVNGIPETYIFGATSSGRIVSWRELEGSCRGTLDHRMVMRATGYTPEGVTP